MAKAKKKFPDLNKDGKITKADILKGRGVFKKGGKVKAKKAASNAPYVSSKSQQTAEKMLDNKLRSEGYTRGRSDARAPSFKLTQDTKSGEYRFRKYSKGGKVKSRVNEAGNYTKPGMRKRLFNAIKAGSKGGRPGQWSARKAQLLANRYKKAGGGYKN
jgi:hypothetical protein